MKNSPRQIAALVLISAGFCCATTRAQNLDIIGITLLQAVATNLNGSGISVGQPEASEDINNPTKWEVNPGAAGVGQRAYLFTYFASPTSDYTNVISTNIYPNSLGSESGHAELVAGNFYGIPNGVATNIAHVDNYDADSFINYYVAGRHSISERIVNQSFIFTETNGIQATASDQQAIDSAYDNYAAQYNTLFISGAGNGSPTHINPPATCYNGIGVGVSDGSSSIGPTIDNGRSKPDIIAPGGETSFSTPYVAGAAAVLMQAALRSDGGGDTNSAADIRTVKALLLNGAIKPANWTNNPPSPLDTRYGAGVLNIFNSYKQLAGGRHAYIVSTTVSTGGAHAPTGATGTVSALSGWDFNTNSSGNTSDTVNHYYFNVTNGVAGAKFTATATLVWNRQQNQSAINNLNLFLYNCANSNLVMCSTSLVDNVEHIFMPQLAQGRYDLQVWKVGGIPVLNIVSAGEPYALAFEFFSPAPAIAKSGANISLSWPIYPAGFVVEATTNLTSLAVWNTNNIPPAVVTNNQNQILLNATNAAQFFRLRRP